MKTKSIYFFYSIIFLSTVLFVEVLYLHSTKGLSSTTISKKITFVNLTKLPDLAICTTASYIRHRSLIDTFNIFKDDGELTEYFPATFAYNHSTLLNNTPSRIVIDVKK